MSQENERRARAGAVAYPPARRGRQIDVLHGIGVLDPYRWLEDPQSDESIRWSAAEKRLFENHQGQWKGREAFREQLEHFARTDIFSTPTWRGERCFFQRRLAGEEHPVVCVVASDGVERVLVDPDQLDLTGETTLDGWYPSVEGERLAYRISRGGTEDSDIWVLDVHSGLVLDGPIPRAGWSLVAWLPGGQGFYYQRRLAADSVPESERQHHRRVWLHRIGSPEAEDVVVFGDGMAITDWYEPMVSRAGRWLIVNLDHGAGSRRNDLYIADLHASSVERPVFVSVQAGVEALSTMRVGNDGRLYVLTDLGAPRRRVCVADPADPAHERWQELIAEDPEAVLEGFSLLDEAELMAVRWTRHAISEITLHNRLTGEQVDVIELPGPGTITAVHSRPEGGHELWYRYVGFATPGTIYRWDARGHTTTVWREPSLVDCPSFSC